MVSVTKAEFDNVSSYIYSSFRYAHKFDIISLFSPVRFIHFAFNIYYILIQKLIQWLFQPIPPKHADQPTKPRGRIAVVGAGLTGVSSAAHAIAHGFDVVIFEKDDRVGGIWAHVNSTSGLQLNSMLYRFHPGVLWSKAFPLRDEILGQMSYIWKTYQLEPRTRFKTPVTSIKAVNYDSEDHTIPDEELDPRQQGHARWVVNDGEEGVFDAVIVTVGTCGKPRWVKFDGMPKEKTGEQDKESGKQEEKTEVKGGDDLKKEKKDERKAPESVWEATKPHPPAQAIESDQESKKSSKFPTPSEAYYDASSTPASVLVTGPQSPSNQSEETDAQEESEGKHGQSVWTNVQQPPPPPPPTAVLEKKDEGKGNKMAELSQLDQFPTPAEAYPITPTSSTPSSPTVTPKSHRKASTSSSSPKKSTEFLSHENEEDKEDKEGTFTRGLIIHSSELDSLTPEKVTGGKKVVVIGSGASGVEAVEAVLEKAGGGDVDVVMLAREDKWIIPRNILIDTLISSQPFGREMPLSFLWEKFIKHWNYYGVGDIVPSDKGLFESTPVVNDTFLSHIRTKKARYVRGDTLRLTRDGVKVNVRQRGSKPGDEGETKVFEADVVVLATGYEKPEVDFLEDWLFPEGYDRPNLYLQNFSTEDWSVLMTNSAYVNAIGTVGHFHIGIYTRVLLTLLMDKNVRPTPKDMKLWVDVVRFIKRGARGGALGFFTYMELTIWLLLFHVLMPDRIRWVFFIMQGWGVTPEEYRA